MQRGKALEVSKMKEKLLCYLAVGGMCDGFFFFEKHQIKPATLIDVRLSEDGASNWYWVSEDFEAGFIKVYPAVVNGMVKV